MVLAAWARSCQIRRSAAFFGPTEPAYLPVGRLNPMPTSINPLDAGRRRAGQLGALDPVLPRARPVLRGRLHRDHHDRGRAVRGDVLRAGVLRDRGVPPVLLAQELQAQPLLAVRLRLHGRGDRAEGRAVVGVEPPPPPPLLRHRPGPPLARARASGGATSAGSSPTSTRPTQLRRHQGLRQVPRAAVHQQARLDRAVDVRRRRVPHRRLVRVSSSASSGRRCCCGTARSS